MSQQTLCPFVARENWKQKSGSNHPAIHILSPGQNPSAAASNRTTGWLLGLSGVHVGEDFRITLGETVLGSGWDADIVLTTPEVSRRHAKLTSSSTETCIQDNGSATGVFVNGEPVSQIRSLMNGDKVRLGVGDFLYIANGDNEPPRAFEQSHLKAWLTRSTAPLAWLICQTGECAGMDFRLIAGANRVGSLPGIDVVIPDANLNSVHMQIECAQDRVYLRPGFSALQLYRAGALIEHPSQLRDGDKLIVGACEMVLRSLI